MFVPLPVPFVFQRTAPDLNAWRLKSPLALRSNSEERSSQLLSSSAVLISPRIFLSRLRPHPSPLLHCLRLCLNLRLSPTRLSAGREYSCQLIDPVEIDSWAGGSRERGRYRESRNHALRACAWRSESIAAAPRWLVLL
ncbi:hypothetical protein D4764_10G0000260 [Takifugu flavidus]|uniref:Uncharacterized protein n=1 Tax=Takifugu flavidus TaxID=433684 RepID=A0A5C6PJ94_9TELE|nr:hypothetical protein D4764_10G0000260 [Takifugu flavidus]